MDRFNTLQHVPIRGNDNYYTLADVLSNGQGLHGEHINLLALLKTVSKYFRDTLPWIRRVDVLKAG